MRAKIDGLCQVKELFTVKEMRPKIYDMQLTGKIFKYHTSGKGVVFMIYKINSKVSKNNSIIRWREMSTHFLKDDTRITKQAYEKCAHHYQESK